LDSEVIEVGDYLLDSAVMVVAGRGWPAGWLNEAAAALMPPGGRRCAYGS